MKKLSFILFMLLFTNILFAKEKKIDQMITVKVNGVPCKFHATGTVTYSIIPPEITSYHITLTGTGEKGTPCGGVLQFDVVVNITYGNGGTKGTKFEIAEGKIIQDEKEIDVNQASSELYEAFAIIQEIYLQTEE